MNTFKLFAFALLVSSVSSFSQSYNPYNQRGYGSMNRDMTGAHDNTQSKPSQAEIEKSRTTKIEKFIAELKEELTLDDLQVIAIRNEITTNSKNVDIIIKKEISEEDKNTEIKALMQQTESRIGMYLNKIQKEKFAAFTAERKNPKKEKKDKKGKKEEQPIEE